MKIARLKLRTSGKLEGTPLEAYLLEDDDIVPAIFDVASAVEAGDLAASLLYIFDQVGKASILRDAAINQGVIKYKGALLRDTSIYIAVLSEFTNLYGENYLSEVLGGPIRDVVSKKLRYEMDPCRCSESDDIKANTQNVLEAAEAILSSIVNSTHSIPMQIKELIAKLHNKLNDAKPTPAFHVIGSFLFLRFFCPAIVCPERFGIIKEGKLSKDTSRGLILVAKVLQNVANEVTSCDKEEYLQPTAEFVAKWVEEFHSFSSQFVLDHAELVEEKKPSPRRLKLAKDTNNHHHVKYLVSFMDKKRSDIVSKLPENEQKVKFFDVMNELCTTYGVGTHSPSSSSSSTLGTTDEQGDQHLPGSSKTGPIWRRVMTKIASPMSPRGSGKGATFPSSVETETGILISDLTDDIPFTPRGRAKRNSVPDSLDPYLTAYFLELEHSVEPAEEDEEDKDSEAEDTMKPLSGRKEKKKRRVAEPSPRTTLMDLSTSPREQMSTSPLSSPKRRSPMSNRRSIAVISEISHPSSSSGRKSPTSGSSSPVSSPVSSPMATPSSSPSSSTLLLSGSPPSSSPLSMLSSLNVMSSSFAGISSRVVGSSGGFYVSGRKESFATSISSSSSSLSGSSSPLSNSCTPTTPRRKKRSNSTLATISEPLQQQSAYLVPKRGIEDELKKGGSAIIPPRSREDEVLVEKEEKKVAEGKGKKKGTKKRYGTQVFKTGEQNEEEGEAEGRKKRISPRARAGTISGSSKKEKEKKKEKKKKEEKAENVARNGGGEYRIEIFYQEGKKEEVVIDGNTSWEEFVCIVTKKLSAAPVACSSPREEEEGDQGEPLGQVGAGGGGKMKAKKKKPRLVFRHPDEGYELKVHSNSTLQWFLKTCGRNVFQQQQQQQGQTVYRLWMI